MKNSKQQFFYPHLQSFPYGRQCIDESDIKAVVETLKSAMLTQGPMISEFENVLCKTVKAQFAAAVCNGTAALHLACLAAGVKKGDEVVTSTNSFVASANCAAYCGAKPVLADIDSKTYNVTAQILEPKINKKTKAIIPIHFAGRSCDMESIKKLVSKKEKQFGHKIYIIEDASHALGSRYKNTMVGSCVYSDMVTMSFHPVKHITTAEGGAVLTNDKNLIKNLRLLRSHGIERDPRAMNKKYAYEQKEVSPWYYEQQILGYNYRISDIQCALGISQIKKLDKFYRSRNKIVAQYNRTFRQIDGFTIPEQSDDKSANFHLYVLLINFEKYKISRTVFMNALKKENILTQVHYIPIHTQPFYQKTYKTKRGDCPNAEKYYEQCISLPLYPSLSKEEVDYVGKTVKNILGCS